MKKIKSCLNILLFSSFFVHHAFSQDILTPCDIKDQEIIPDAKVFMRFELGFDIDRVAIFVEGNLIGVVDSMTTSEVLEVTRILLQIEKVSNDYYCIKLLSNEFHQPSFAKIVYSKYLNENILKLKLVVNGRENAEVINLDLGKYLYIDRKRRNRIRIRQSKVLVRLE
jgi:hypothetical protein